jgi:nitroreductase
MLKDLIRKNRSFRRFEESHAVDLDTLHELVDLARLSASGANMQPLKYVLTNTPAQNAKVFPHLGWAGYLAYWHGPEEGERPATYIIILGDTEIKDAQHIGIDPGIAAQSIMLGAAEKGLGGCMLASIQKDDLRRDLNIPAQYEILLVLALGKPAETVVLEDLPEDGSIKYYRDDQDVHHVPKRPLAEIIVEL